MKKLLIAATASILVSTAVHAQYAVQIVGSFHGNDILVDVRDHIMEEGYYTWDRCFVSNYGGEEFKVYVSDYRHHRVVETDMFIPLPPAIRRDIEAHFVRNC